MDEAKMLVDFF